MTIDTEPVFAFLAKLTPFPREEGDWLRIAADKRIGVAPTEDGLVRFLYLSRVGDDWVLHSTITVEPSRRFWVRVVEVIKTFATQMGLIPPFALTDEEVASGVVSGLPDAPHLTQERAREDDAPQPRRRSASLPEPGVRVVKSKRKTVTRGGQPEEPDILDQ